MKWIHKLTGWEAHTQYYQYPEKGAQVQYEAGGQKVTFYLPLNIIQSDSNWIEMPDDRWLGFTLTARQFMELFSMTIDPRGTSHDSAVVKGAIDKTYMDSGKKMDEE